MQQVGDVFYPWIVLSNLHYAYYNYKDTFQNDQILLLNEWKCP